jgi:tRNA C32,U32 (ribose-2'-O)-methylase TrmJ
MSTLNVANISDGTDTVETGYVVNGSAKAWVHASNAAAILDSLNVASGLDNGVGNYTYTYTTAQASTSYSSQANARVNSGSAYIGVINIQAETTITVGTYRTSTDARDDRENSFTAFGDLA